MENKIAIFSCMTGGYDIPTDNFEKREGYDYYMFTDKPIRTVSWRQNMLAFSDDRLSDIKRSRFVKTHPMSVLPNYDIVVWIDANTTIDDKLYDYIERYKDNPVTSRKRLHI